MRNRPVAIGLIISALVAVPCAWVACTSPGTAPKTVATAMPADLAAGFGNTVHPFIKTYCVECHSGEKPKAELDLTKFDSMSAVARDTDRWDQVLERLSAAEMPPDDADKQPTAAERQPVVAWLQSLHKFEAQRTAGDPGIVLARRLSNAEYDYTVRDLTGVDIRPTKEFPVDPANEAGFDNSGESLAMSPALVKKYLEAARNVADHIVFKPDGFDFAPYPMTTYEDRDKYAVHRVVDFYQRQHLDLADFLQAAWRYHFRAQLGQPNATLADVARAEQVSPKYLATVWAALNEPVKAVGPMAALRERWRNISGPVDGKEPASVRDRCENMANFITQLRTAVKCEFPNLVPNGRNLAPGSQTMVLWKDRQYAANRTNYTGQALEVDLYQFIESDPLLTIPTAPGALADYEQSFKRFCAVFPDAFYISERPRMFLTNPKDIASDLSGHRLLTAGFHSQMGYFRDDRPLYDMVLNPAQQKEIDQLWDELDFITHAPFRQFRQFIWFERAEPPSFMNTAEFNSFRSEDDDIISEPKLKQLAVLYSAKIQKRELSAQIARTVDDYFIGMNQEIRDLERSQLAAEPVHLKSLLAFAERACRRPLSSAERDDILKFYRQLRGEKLSHEDAIRDSVVSILMSPTFSYRVELPRARVAATTGTQPLTDYELANRLSYFLWSSMPDEKLLAHAAAGDLHQPEVLLAETQRLLRDDRVRGFATEFGGNWLDIRRFEEHNAVDRERFPQFTNELREAMFDEPMHFTANVVQQNASVLDFIYGNYTFVNAQLARHYGMPEPQGPASTWVRVDGADKYGRGGLLPMAAFLTKHAPGLRTSPVKRGHWVVTKLLGERIPAPPPNVPVLPTDETKLGELTLPQTLAKHRADKNCASCHNKFDSFGLVFEGFGPVGETRTTDLAGRPASTRAVFPDGSEGEGVKGLQDYIRAKTQNEFLDNLCRKLLVYALGRTLLPSDDFVLAAMREKLASHGYHFDAMVNEIVTSRQFLTKRVAAENVALRGSAGTGSSN